MGGAHEAPRPFAPLKGDDQDGHQAKEAERGDPRRFLGLFGHPVRVGFFHRELLLLKDIGI